MALPRIAVVGAGLIGRRHAAHVAAQAELFAVLRELATDGAGVLVVAHDLSLAAIHCGRLLLLAGGRVVAQGPPPEVVSAENVARVYGAGIDVITDPRGGGPLVVPARQRIEG